VVGVCAACLDCHEHPRIPASWRGLRRHDGRWARNFFPLYICEKVFRFYKPHTFQPLCRSSVRYTTLPVRRFLHPRSRCTSSFYAVFFICLLLAISMLIHRTTSRRHTQSDLHLRAKWSPASAPSRKRERAPFLFQEVVHAAPSLWVELIYTLSSFASQSQLRKDLFLKGTNLTLQNTTI
jgi:hypothetical protein